MTRVRWIHAAWIVAMTIGLTGAFCVVKDSAKGPAVATTAAVRVAYGQLPLSFEANQGQTGRQVQFLSRGRGYNLFLTPTDEVARGESQPDRHGIG